MFVSKETARASERIFGIALKELQEEDEMTHTPDHKEYEKGPVEYATKEEVRELKSMVEKSWAKWENTMEMLDERCKKNVISRSTS